ncbi:MULTISPECIES: TonB-dependent receptor [Chryseobacterium]|uniref:Outer membrane receptor protein involved in Fe transport n=1 Tax=Chryseobacterium geocarposphaerae TaxID=1416776 RepID=A0ABU1LA52_9FLAO|nr:MULTISPECIES: TonB-dependent receptor [Chryseobacterium]MDR6403597.1 outer membrane receptor protein involved in Fe transport [Chryseobacterium geocarposphaerae]MDR6697151.1 outer membrane receptor protein involved in Fe transport [Chryseobacterium ginsenosidimutans]
MARIFLLIFVWILSALSLLKAQTTQNFSLSGKVDSDKVNQMEINLFDSENKLIKTEIADNKGNFVFTDLVSGNYSIKINKNGTEAYKADNISVSGNTTLPSIQLNEKMIEGVTITKTKPYIERQEGKMILNVENSIASTGNSAFEVLEKAPGVKIDNNDNISLRGKGNLLVQIDGKNTPMTGTDLANYLRGIPSASVEKVEFITNPSSKYDASGTSIINIKLKKDQRKGTNGSISTSLGTGRFIKNNNNFSINHRNKKVNVFANYSFAYREFFNHLMLDRNFYTNTIFEKAYVQDNFLKMNFRNHIAKAGMDYYMNDKNILGFSVGFISNRFDPTGDNSSVILGSDHLPTGTFTTQNRTRNHWKNTSINLNHKYTIDSLGSELTTDFDYINYSNTSLQNFDTRNYDVNGNLSPSAPDNPNPYLLKGDIGGNLNIFSLKSDFTKALKNDWKLEGGVKTSLVKADNDLKFFNVSLGDPVLDETKTNHYIYEENINAIYGNVSKKWKKFSTNFGLRLENTNVKGTQITTNQVNKKNYTQLFPSAVLSYDITEKSNLEVNFSRRITRPSYNQLNPFKFYLDPTTYRAGNPDLNPQTTMNYELTYSLSNKYFATLSYSKTSDNITEVIKPVVEDGKNITVQTNENLNSASYFGLNLIAPFKIATWWDMNNSANFYYGSYTGNVSGTQINNKGNFTFSLNSINSFKLGNGFTAELTGNYQAREVYAYMDVQPIWFLNIGAQKKFKNNSTLKLAFNDVFFTSNPKARTTFNNYVENFVVERDSRVITLSYTYNFGSSKSGQPRKTGGAEDLKQRIGNG